jgi:hypothetical protein
MNEKLYTDLITSQVRTLRISAELHLPAGHPTLTVLDEALSKLEGQVVNTARPLFNDAIANPAFGEIIANNPNLADLFNEVEIVELNVPDGFTEESYKDFITEQLGEDLGEEILANGGVPVAGLVPNEEGELIEVGNFDEAADATDEAIRELEEATGEERFPENILTVRYTRLDGQELTEDQTKTIVEHPISETLKKMGDIYLGRVEETDSISSKDAVFIVEDENKNMLKQLAYRATAYRGVHVFAGLGRVQAVGEVNFL